MRFIWTYRVNFTLNSTINDVCFYSLEFLKELLNNFTFWKSNILDTTQTKWPLLQRSASSHHVETIQPWTKRKHTISLLLHTKLNVKQKNKKKHWTTNVAIRIQIQPTFTKQTNTHTHKRQTTLHCGGRKQSQCDRQPVVRCDGGALQSLGRR